MLARIIAYILFSVFTVPVEIWTFIVRAVGERRANIIDEIYAHGLFYVVSIVLMAETTFRLYHSRHRLKYKEIFEVINLLTLGFTVILIVFYESIEQMLLGQIGIILDSTGIWQTRLTIISCCVALITFISCELLEDRSHLERRLDYRFDYERRQRR